MMKKAVVAGHICLDVIPAVDHHFDLIPGRLYEVGSPTLATGGAVSNTGLSMHILGTPVTLMGKIGDDSFGNSVKDIIRRRADGMDKGMTVVPGEVTSYTMVINIPGIDRIFLHCPGANASYVASDINWDLVKEADLFHFGYPAFMAGTYANEGRELISMYRHAKELGLTTSMDPGMPDVKGPAGKVNWKKLLSEVLPFVDVFMPSSDELLYMLCPERFGEGDNLSVQDLEKLGAELIDMGAAVAAIKLGKRGMYIRSAADNRISQMGHARPADITAWANREMLFPIFKERVFKGATGAGDASIGGFLCALLRGLSMEEAGLFAGAVGACNVEAPDSLSGVQSWDATQARIAAGWEKIHLDIAADGWTLDSQSVWVGPCRH